MIRLRAKPADAPAAAAAGEGAAGAAAAATADEGKEAKEEPAVAAGAGRGRGAKVFGIGRGKRATADPKDPGRSAMSAGELRVQKDLADLDAGTVAKIAFPDANNLTEFSVTVTPDTGLWKGATYQFTFKIPRMYPHEAPKVHCETPIYHPNIDLDGNVCLNILREDWKPVLDLNAVIYGLIYLFYEPNPDDPLNHEAADVFRRDYEQFRRSVAASLRGTALIVGGRRVTFPALLR